MSEARRTSRNYLALGVALIATVAVIASAAGQFDGTYTGSQRSTHIRPGACVGTLDRNDVKIVINSNHFTRPLGSFLSPQWPMDESTDVDIAPDGTFRDFKAFTNVSGAPRVFSITGKIISGDLEADFGTPRCGFHLSLKKS